MRQIGPFEKYRRSSRAGFIGCVLMLMLMYFLLLGPTNSIFSVYNICAKTQAFVGESQYLIFCLLPIYFAVMIFGGGALGWLAGRKAYKICFKHAVKRSKSDD